MSNAIGSYLPQPISETVTQGSFRKEKPSGFSDALSAAIGQTDKLQADADLQISNLVQGKDQDVHSTMIAVEKADISFQLMMQVRNKIVNAYQEISRMQF